MSLSKLFFGSLTSLQVIYEARSISLIKGILYFVLLNFILILPLNIGLLQMEEFRYELVGITFHQETPNWWFEDLPECSIVNQELLCTENIVSTFESNDGTLVIDPLSNYTAAIERGMIFQKEGFLVITDEIKLEFDYSGFDQTFNKRLLRTLTEEESAKLVIDNLFMSAKDEVVIVMMILISGLLLIGNFILLTGLALISMLMKFGDPNVPRFKEVWMIYVFSSTIPSMIGLGIGFIGGFAFGSVLYNFITPIIAFLVYRKYIRGQFVVNPDSVE